MNNFGQLYVIGTPIGNLKDITIRALDILNSVDFILCEDTRQTGILLKHYQISKETHSLNARNEKNKLKYFISRLMMGENAALVSDAGTPLISDPGVFLVAEAHKNEIQVNSIPGPSSVTAALSISGFPSDSFSFFGFLPQKKGRQKVLAEISDYDHTIVLFESSHRIEKLLKELSGFFPERYVMVAREITKKFEESLRGNPAQILSQLTVQKTKGEFVVLITGKKYKQSIDQ